MRIAVLAHVRHPVAPPFMGGMEAHSWHLAAGLARRGHEVTLFASGDSAAGLPPGVKLRPVLEQHYDARFPWHRWHGTDALNAHLDAGFAQACRELLEGGFDIVHNNSLHRFPPRLARQMRLPMVTSLHVPPFPVLQRAVQESAAPWAWFTSTSRSHGAAWWRGTREPPQHRVVANGIDLEAWPYAAGGDGSAVWAGRITPTKGPHLAAAAAARAGVPLTLFGTIEHQGYFDEKVRPWLGGAIRYGGHATAGQLSEAYRRASVFLFTPMWEEPFGLAAVEAMASGLPVAATSRGAVREVIGPAGRFADTEDEASLAAALQSALRIDPLVPRRRVERCFTGDRMISRCLALYAKARAGLDAAAPSRRFPQHALRIAAPAMAAG
ncbi:glycosyltransferase [Cribrihabitans neustonicus]|uniref:glycosyltransferase n=1 Tax=Cribrihabitans neustonicus TaxID=1429085 RepID=UPI003B5B329A